MYFCDLAIGLNFFEGICLTGEAISGATGLAPSIARPAFGDASDSTSINICARGDNFCTTVTERFWILFPDTL